MFPCTTFVKRNTQIVVDHLANLWQDKFLSESDVAFKCNEKSIKAHTLIFASGSSVFAAISEKIKFNYFLRIF